MGGGVHDALRVLVMKMFHVSIGVLLLLLVLLVRLFSELGEKANSALSAKS